MKLRLKRLNEAGFLMPGVLSFIIAMTIFGAALLMVILNNFYVVGNNITSQKAMNIAEGGLNYYLWHLSHNPSDYKDGQSTPATPDPALGYGPYIHDYTDVNGKKLGTYTLWLKPKGNGSTIVTVRSIGQTVGSSITRTLEAQIGAQSFASYGVLGDTALWFGNNETANGPVYSNQGVRMDGANADIVGSANATYIPPANLGGNGSASHPGVWCDTSVTSPVNCSTRDKTNWLYPQSSIDFNQVTGSLCTMKKTAFADSGDAALMNLATQPNACSQTPTTRTASYIPQLSSSFSSTKGYLIQLHGDQYDLYKVNGETDTAASYATALSLTPVQTNIGIPTQGVIYTEDNVWVRTSGTAGSSAFDGRVNIGSGRLASSSATTDVHIADDVAYLNKNGTDAIGLVAEGDVIIAPYAPPATGNFNFEIDAAVLAQSGSVTYPEKYTSSRNRCTRGWVSSGQVFTFYGAVASRNTWTWNIQWGGSCGDNVRDPLTGNWISGVMHTDTRYDYNLLYSPPPQFPITGGYQILTWREVLTRP